MKIERGLGYFTLRESRRPAQLATILFIALACNYLWWRTFHSLNLSAPLISIPFLIADFIGFAFFLLFAFQLWSCVHREAFPPPDGMTVDVYIATYNEDAVILRSTITAALAMRYPHETYVLDDGRRDAIRALCDELGARYLVRPDNKGAKAGNINAALPRTEGEFVAIFDADHAPFANFLTDLLGYFRDPAIALVQAPQTYYNLDSFQHFSGRNGMKALRHEQSVFFDEILPGKDRHNAVFWCGSTAILRRTALEQTGGVDTRTITEDMHTAMMMHTLGWKTVYHERPLAVGIAPDDATAFLVQRLRWAVGAVQVLRKTNPLFMPGLTLAQRVSYFASVAYVFEYVPKAVYLFIPVVALFFGALPMANMGWSLIVNFVPYYIAGLAANQLLTRGTAPLFTAERFYALKMWIMLRAALTFVIPGNPTFQVTPKSSDGQDHRWAAVYAFKWQIIVGALSACAVAWAFAGWALALPWRLGTVELAVTSVWALFNASMILHLLRIALKRHHRRKTYRFAVSLPAIVARLSPHEDGATPATVHPVTMTDLSALGCAWVSVEPYLRGESVTLAIHTRAGEVIHATATVNACRSTPDGGNACGASFQTISKLDMDRLIVFLYQLHMPQLFGYRGTQPVAQLVQRMPTPMPTNVEATKETRAA